MYPVYRLFSAVLTHKLTSRKSWVMVFSTRGSSGSIAWRKSSQGKAPANEAVRNKSGEGLAMKIL